jgi:hypothetical protein
MMDMDEVPLVLRREIVESLYGELDQHHLFGIFVCTHGLHVVGLVLWWCTTCSLGPNSESVKKVCMLRVPSSK